MNFSEGTAAVVAYGFLFCGYDCVGLYGFLSGIAWVSFGSAWKTFSVFCAAAGAGCVEAS